MHPRWKRERKMQPKWKSRAVVSGREWDGPPLKKLSDGKWEIRADYVVPAHRKGLQDVTVPAGFVCDGASVPRILFPIAAPMGDALFAALVHDWRYFTLDPDDREFADDEFYYNMIDTGIGSIRARLIWRGVRIGGWLPWGRRHA